MTGDAVFTITNATPTAAHPDGVFARGVTAVSQLELPAAKTKYYLTVHHADAAAPKDGSYALSGFYANVGTVKFARTSVTARENAASVASTVLTTEAMVVSIPEPPAPAPAAPDMGGMY